MPSFFHPGDERRALQAQPGGGTVGAADLALGLSHLRRQDVKGFLRRRPLWLLPAANPGQVLRFVMGREAETRRYYRRGQGEENKRQKKELS
jgi:hypothetical protein